MGAEEDKETTMNLLIVAAKKEIVDSYMKVFSLAGLNLLILDVDIFAVTNMLERIHGPQQFSVVAADIGASVTNIAILKGESIEFTREILIGGKYLTNEIAKAHRLERAEAEEKKLLQGGDVQELIDDFAGNVSSEINKTVNFYVATKPRETVGKIYLTGGSSLVPGLKERIEKETGIEVAFLDPSMFLTSNGTGVMLEENDGFFMPVALYLSSRVSDLEP
jgi:type IV pilus assembly protein PilM